MKIISIMNLKGGVAKTTIAQHLSCGLSACGYKVLALDLDEQRSLSICLGAPRKPKYTTFDLLQNTCKPQEAILKLKECDLISASTELNQLALNLPKKKETAFLLQDQLKKLNKKYDYIIIDTAPSQTILTLNSLVASDEIIIPTENATFSILGIIELKKYIETAKAINNKLVVKGVLLIKCGMKKKLNANITKALEYGTKELNTKVFNARIRSSAKIDSLQQKCISCFEAIPNAPITQDFKRFINEFAEKELFTIIEE